MPISQTRPGGQNAASIEAAKGSIAWTPKSELGRPEWISIGRRLGRIGRCNQWWLGDWLRYGSAKWGERYSAAARITGYDPRSLANVASLASTFPLSRRRDNLTWSHHAAVAALPVEDQDRWLDRAEEERLSVADLRVELRAVQGPGSRSSNEEEAPAEEEELLVCPRCGYRIEGEEEDG
jgi:hypothetical protein